MPRFTHICLCFALALAAGYAHADIYGFVDENGVAHLSNAQLDARYTLFRKVAAEAAAPHSDVNAREPAAVFGLQKPYGDIVAAVAREQGLDAALLHAVITVESRYDARAKSPKGASGLMQLIPETAKRFGVTDIWDPLENIRGGARYLRALLGIFNDNLHLALAAYNAGEGAVMRSGNRIPPYPETRAYVPRVMEFYKKYRAMQMH